MAGHGEQVDAERFDVERQLSHRLRGVGVDEDAALVIYTLSRTLKYEPARNAPAGG